MLESVRRDEELVGARRVNRPAKRVVCATSHHSQFLSNGFVVLSKLVNCSLELHTSALSHLSRQQAL